MRSGAITCASICGSDLWPNQEVESSNTGCRMGYEAIGVVEAVGAGVRSPHQPRRGRGAWLHIAEGALALNGVALATGDGASTEAPGTLTLTATEPAEAILFDLK